MVATMQVPSKIGSGTAGKKKPENKVAAKLSHGQIIKNLETQRGRWFWTISGPGAMAGGYFLRRTLYLANLQNALDYSGLNFS